MVEIVLLKWKYDAAKSANAKVSVSSGAGITFPAWNLYSGKRAARERKSEGATDRSYDANWPRYFVEITDDGQQRILWITAPGIFNIASNFIAGATPFKAYINRFGVRRYIQGNKKRFIFDAGLLHDIGRLILSDKVPDQLIEVDQLEISKRIDTIQAETEVIGYDHTMVSKGLMQQWGLPEVLCECVKNHHEVEHTGEYADASRIIYLANRA